MESYFVSVRDSLIDALGDHMVASTVFSKRIKTIFDSYYQGVAPCDCARALWDTEFAGADGYETA